jgi:hypothetical protein
VHLTTTTHHHLTVTTHHPTTIFTTHTLLIMILPPLLHDPTTIFKTHTLLGCHKYVFLEICLFYFNHSAQSEIPQEMPRER